MTAHFFEATGAYQRENTALFDFITPTAVAVWNLRWQVAGFIEASPDATKAELEGRFIGGADLSGLDLRRANLRRAASERSWEDHLADFGRVMLFVAVSLYEGGLLRSLRSSPHRRPWRHSFSYPPVA